MKKDRLKKLAGLNENINVKAAISSFEKIHNELTKLQDEIYDMDEEDRTSCLETLEDVSSILKKIKATFAKYL